MTHGDQNFITTIGGRRFWPMDPRAEDIDVRDIAHALSLICRFNGHVREFYSVAQHSLLVSYHLPEEIALYGLLHDAAEAYVGDMSGPLKHDPRMQHYDECDDRLQDLIYRRFGLVQAEPAQIKSVDRLLICDEARELTPLATRPPALSGPGLGIRISPMPPEEARHAFLFRFHQLAGVTA